LDSSISVFIKASLAWLTFRPGLEALLMTGKFVDVPANADVWKNREADWKAYQEVFFRERAAHYLGEINALHPFREGNTRALRKNRAEGSLERLNRKAATNTSECCRAL